MGVQTERPSSKEIEAAVKDWGDMLFRLSFTMLGNQADSQCSEIRPTPKTPCPRPL